MLWGGVRAVERLLVLTYFYVEGYPRRLTWVREVPVVQFWGRLFSYGAGVPHS